jgi:hypothetical protein
LKHRTTTKWILSLLILGLVGCTTSLQEDSQGWFLMRYYTDEEKGIRGLEPLNWGENAVIIQESFPGNYDELTQALFDETSLEEYPQSTGTYKGAELTWKLYSFETQIQDLGQETVRVELAIAEGNAKFYFVALVALPEEYSSNEDKFWSVYLHTIYALSPYEGS